MKVNIFLLLSTCIILGGCNSAKKMTALDLSHRKAEINLLMDQWHRAAATADEDVFFGSMTPDAIYIGTDSSEYWLRDELATWSAKYFDKETAWSFEPIHRNIYLDSTGNTAWFDELLDTWMAASRSSGVVERQADHSWKIKHYHLSIAVPNDVVQDYLDILEKSKSK